VFQEERSIFWEVTVSVILSKKGLLVTVDLSYNCICGVVLRVSATNPEVSGSIPGPIKFSEK
jgi:hypothetical protein